MSAYSLMLCQGITDNSAAKPYFKTNDLLQAKKVMEEFNTKTGYSKILEEYASAISKSVGSDELYSIYQSMNIDLRCIKHLYIVQ